MAFPDSLSCGSCWRGLLLFSALCAGLARAQTDPTFESAADVNEGSLLFLPAPPDKPVHHHQNIIRIDEDSLRSGWVSLSQCHDHLDAVPRAQITFRDGFVRALKVNSFNRIEDAWIEGATVQLRNVRSSARLCLSAQTRALRQTGNGYYNLSSGPYMRKFLDGYYPMRLTLEVHYPASLLKLIDIAPPAQPGLRHEKAPGAIRLDAMFEGVLQILIQFETP
jgi:hypothetical protein